MKPLLLIVMLIGNDAALWIIFPFSPTETLTVSNFATVIRNSAVPLDS